MEPLIARILALAVGVERNTMIWGAIGCGLCMVLLCALVYVAEHQDMRAPAYAAAARSIKETFVAPEAFPYPSNFA
ncbi:hypothetical protein JCM6882_007154 [Rhodosporidiobolus microsporus]